MRKDFARYLEQTFTSAKKQTNENVILDYDCNLTLSTPSLESPSEVTPPQSLMMQPQQQQVSIGTSLSSAFASMGI